MPPLVAAAVRRLRSASVCLSGLLACHVAWGVDTSTDADQLIARLHLQEAPTAVRDLPGWRKPPKILVLDDNPDRIRWLQSVAPGVELLASTSATDIPKLVKDVDGLIGDCDPKLIEIGRSLRWIQAASAGVDHCVSAPQLRTRHIILTNTQRVSGPSVAEHAIALMFALSRGTAGYARSQAQERYDQGAVPAENMIEIEGRTMLVVGLGGIGTEIAWRAHGLGMKVIATNVTVQDRPDYVSYVGKADELPALVGRADVIVNAAPLTPQTRGLFDSGLFARMKHSALFINIGRGGSVVQPDLIAALQSRKIGGAGLDVVTPEPLPQGDPLWKAPNLIITPHVGGESDLNQERIWIVMRENLRRYVAGDKMLSVVDVARGY